MWKKLFAVSTVLMGVGLGKTHAEEELLRRVAPSAYQLTWASNGETCLVKFGIDRYEVLDASGQSLWSRELPVNNVVLSPDGTQVAYVLMGDGLYVYSLKNQKERKILNTSGAQLVQLAWASSSDKLAYWLFPDNAATDAPGQFKMISVDKN